MAAITVRLYLSTIAYASASKCDAMLQELSELNCKLTPKEKYNILKAVLETACQREKLNIEIEDFEDNACKRTELGFRIIIPNADGFDIKEKWPLHDLSEIGGNLLGLDYLIQLWTK